MSDATSHHWKTTGVWWRVLCLGSLLLCGAATPAHAGGRERTIHQFYHSRWTVKDGAPGQIAALAQSSDGVLWLAAAAALYSFDGVRFERFEPPSGGPLPSIQTLYAPPGGGVWLGFQHGGAAFVKDGHVTRYGEAQGLPVAQVSSFAVDTRGVVWTTGVLGGLFQLREGRWHRAGDDWSFPEKDARAAFVDRDGALWVAVKDRLLYLPKDGRAFRETGASVAWVSRIAQAPDGMIWIAEPEGSVRPVALPGGKPYPESAGIEVKSAGLLFDREGSLWATSLGDGMRRLPHPERLGARRIGRLDAAAESLTEKDGLSADYTWPIIEDREGNIWVGTSGGLDRFRHSTLVLAEFPRGSHDFALAAGDDGAMWAGSTNRPLMRLHDARVELTELVPPVVSAYRDPDGVVWLGARGSLWRIEHGRPVRVTELPTPDTARQVQSMTKDAHGGLWVTLSGGGTLRWKDGGWTSMDALLGTPDRARVLSATTDARGRVWLGARGEIVVVDGGQVRRYGAADGIDIGLVTSLKAGRRLWAGGQFGLLAFDGQRFQGLAVEDSEPLRGVAAILEMPDGDLWLHAVSGIFHLPEKEVARALAEPGYRARGERFDFLDGLPARPTLLRPLPTAVQGTDGRLWFATTNGVVWIDPTRIVRNPLPPPVAIRGVRVDGRLLPPAEAVTLPVRATNIEIDYTALSYTIPERVRFRYRLEGVDETWQDVGTRREAYYTHLDPGRYRFHVIAANNDGVWNETGAVLELTLPPAYFQTWWFRAALIALLLAGLRLLYLERLRQVRAHMRSLLDERHRERERIARELHDTLLQGVHGLVLRFQVAAEMIPPGEPARASMERALERADDILVEGRDRVMDLRAASEEHSELSEDFASVGQELAQDHPVGFRGVVEGEPTPLDPIVRDEVFRIGREALVNAFQHASAKRIEVELTYDPDELRLRIRDDGRGVDPEFLQAGGRPGHWGLSGMRERARKIGARLDIWCRDGSGTEVELRVPGAVAYRGGARRTWGSRLRRLVGGGR
ncbi:two-component regulator propeller domain-containing protein [Pyxidicoccus sp. 3LG]